MKVFTQSVAVSIMLAVPVGAFGQSDDAKYCQALMDVFRNLATSNSPNPDIPLAMENCASGDPAAGIPIIEKALRDAKVALPPRN